MALTTQTNTIYMNIKIPNFFFLKYLLTHGKKMVAASNLHFKNRCEYEQFVTTVIEKCEMNTYLTKLNYSSIYKMRIES